MDCLALLAWGSIERRGVELLQSQVLWGLADNCQGESIMDEGALEVDAGQASF